MNEDSPKGISGKLLDAYGDLVNDRFVGREGLLSHFRDILDYPRVGKSMPTIILRGPAGMGKSWLAYRFVQELAERRIPVISLDSRPEASRLPGGFEFITRDLAKRFDLTTPRFDRVYRIYARRYLGIEIPKKESESSLFKDLIRSFRKEPDDEEPESPAIREIYGEDWPQILPARPIPEHLSSMALALSEDIESAFQQRKYPFLALVIDDWDAGWNRFYPHWKRLFETSNRLLTIVATTGEVDFHGSIQFPIVAFNDAESRAALRRRGIETNHAVADIIAESRGNPTIISIAASLAELISRSGDIIKENSFAVPENERLFNYFAVNIFDRLRESEKEALYIISHTPGIDAANLSKLFPEDPDLIEELISLIASIPIEPILREDSPIRIHPSVYSSFAPLSEAGLLPADMDIVKRTEELSSGEDRDHLEVLGIRILSRVDSKSALARAFERIVHYSQTGQIGLAEDIWRASAPPDEDRGLCAIHKDIGERLLWKTLSPEQRANYYDVLGVSDAADEGNRRIGYARAMAENGYREIALDELNDTITLLSAAITETSGREPALWYVRGRVHLLASHLIQKSGAYEAAFSSAQKAAESFKKTREIGLDCAGIVSIQTACAQIAASESEASLNKLRSAMTWLNLARESLSEATAKRKDKLPDILLLSVKTLAMKGELLKQKGSYETAEEFLSAALDEVNSFEDRFGPMNPEAALSRAEIRFSLAELLAQSGSEESAFDGIRDALMAFERYEEIIGGPDPKGWIGKGKTLLLKSSILSGEDTEKAIAAAREADGYFKNAWTANPSDEAALGRIDALISIAELLAEEGKLDSAIFDEVTKILAERTTADGTTLPLLKRQIRLYRARGTASYLKDKFTNAARYYASAVKLYSKLNELAPEFPFAAELAEIHMASAIAFRKAGEPREAFESLLRAEEAFEIAADESTKGGLKRVLHLAIEIYNDFASTGRDEEAFEIALFILEMSAALGGTEVLEVGQELLTYWETQELSPHEKRRLDSAAKPLREQWGDF